MSRPEIPIDWKLVDDMLIDGCTGTEIASTVGMHPETFYDRVVKKFSIGFTEYKTQKQAVGDGLVRRAQMKKALKGDSTMLIWLGKQKLGQRENNVESMVATEVEKRFNAVMDQLKTLQSGLHVDTCLLGGEISGINSSVISSMTHC